MISSSSPKAFLNNGNREIQYNPSNWLSALLAIKDGAIRNMRLNALVMMGTHDSATYDITRRSKVSPDASKPLQVIGDLPVIRGVIKNWSKAQEWDIEGQLKGGVRYLDIRIAFDGKKFVACHGKYAAPLDVILNQLNAFYAENPDEIVLLDFQHFYNMTNDDHDRLVKILKDSLGNKVADPAMGANVTVGQLWEEEKQAILFYGDESVVNRNADFLWDRDENLFSPWADTSSADDLKKFQEKALTDPNRLEKFFVMQNILTPDVEMIIKSFCPEFPHSLEAVAKELNPIVMGWFENDALFKTGNILMFDEINNTVEELFQFTMSENIRRIEEFQPALEPQKELSQILRPALGGYNINNYSPESETSFLKIINATPDIDEEKDSKTLKDLKKAIYLLKSYIGDKFLHPARHYRGMLSDFLKKFEINKNTTVNELILELRKAVNAYHQKNGNLNEPKGDLNRMLMFINAELNNNSDLTSENRNDVRRP